MQAVQDEFFDLLEERRKDYDIMWISRSMKPLSPHKLPPEIIYTREQAIAAALLDHNVQAVIRTLAVTRGVAASTIIAEARGMLEEMASKAHLPTVRWIGLIITKVLKRILISIRLNQSLLYRIKNQMCISQVQYVYAPTHRSYLDFILLSYILFSYDMALPNIASGMDFYKMKVVGELLRHTGAFYMRRSFSSDPLYKEIFRAYVGSLVAHSDRAIEFFIEGTRSRSQKTLSPKFGLLSAILEGLFQSKVPDIQFIPISISYDKPLEELLFVYELLGVPKPAESTTGLFRSLSILREPFAHGHVYLRIASPISAREFVDMETRKLSALSPHAKLPPHITKKVAYAIVDTQKQNTILTPFNLISLLFNERMYYYSKQPYSLHDLFQDYQWIKNELITKFKAIVHPYVSNDLVTEDSTEDVEKREILESLETHKNLIEIDSDDNLQLKNRHVGVTQRKGIKGHPLTEETLKIAVPVINLMIYVNPVFAYLSKPALAALCIDLPTQEMALKRYIMLRSLFSTEFALPTDITDSELTQEWRQLSTFFINENGEQYSNSDQIEHNMRLLSILRNLLIPYIVSLQTMCNCLSQWEKSVECTEKNLTKECQRRIEELLYVESATMKHPYSLSLDIYPSLLSSLVMYRYVIVDKCGFYQPNSLVLETITFELQTILKQFSNVSYTAICSTQISKEIPNLQAKL